MRGMPNQDDSPTPSLWQGRDAVYDLSARSKVMTGSIGKSMGQGFGPAGEAAGEAIIAADAVVPAGAILTMPSPQQFAASIKAKYPQYAEIPDDELVTRILDKHPVYRDQITQPEPQPQQAIAPQPQAPPEATAAIHGAWRYGL